MFLKKGLVYMSNATFNNISVVSWQSVLVMEKTSNLPQVSLSGGENI
jgi:hypothetical protein